MDESLKKSLITLKTAADEAYFNSGDPIMSDEAYDGLCTALTSKVSELSQRSIGSIGYKTRINRVKLPVHMGSLDKHNDQESLDNFLDKLPTNYVSVQEKLDGVSCLYHFHNGAQHIYTRGDGSTGSNISHILQYGFTISSDPLHRPKAGLDSPSASVPECESTPVPVGSVPVGSVPVGSITHPLQPDLMIRGELIVPKKIFDTKYASTFSNGRNMVSGLLSLKEPSADAFADVHFVAYELITFGNQSTAGGKAKSAFGRIQDQFNFLTLNKFRIVYNRVLEKNCLDVDSLTEYVSRRKKRSVYELDGLVLMTVERYARNCAGNPDYACAFKILNETAITRVQRVEWNLSKHGKYKPRVITDPVKLGSVEVSAFTGFNAKYIVEKGVTPGSGLLVTRSGDTIPHILEVFSGSRPEGPTGMSSTCGVVLPDNAVWKSVDLYLCDRTCERADKEEVEKKRLVHFLSSLKCLNCKYETVSKMFNAGFRTIKQLLETNVEELAEIDGIGSVLGKKILTSLRQNISKATTHELLAAMNAFGEGIGLKKIRLLNLNNPGEAVKGISQTTFDTKIFPVFDDKLEYARQLKKLALRTLSTVPKAATLTSESEEEFETLTSESEEEFEDSRRRVSSNLFPRSLEGRVFVFTGFRDGALENRIIDLGGRVTSAISNKSTDLVVDKLGCKSSTKLVKARAQGIQIVTRKDLIPVLFNK